MRNEPRRREYRTRTLRGGTLKKGWWCEGDGSRYSMQSHCGGGWTTRLYISCGVWQVDQMSVDWSGTRFDGPQDIHTRVVFLMSSRFNFPCILRANHVYTPAASFRQLAGFGELRIKCRMSKILSHCGNGKKKRYIKTTITHGETL